MISTMLLLAGAIGLGLRLMRWVATLPDNTIETRRPEPPTPSRRRGWSWPVL
jgi:hypothetical protein